MSEETFVNMLKWFFPPCPVCKFYIKYCRCGKDLCRDYGMGL